MRTWKQWKDKMKDHLNPKRAYDRGYRAGRKTGKLEAMADSDPSPSINTFGMPVDHQLIDGSVHYAVTSGPSEPLEVVKLS